MDGNTHATPVERIAAAAGDLPSVDWDACPTSELAEALAVLERAVRAVDAAQCRASAALARRLRRDGRSRSATADEVARVSAVTGGLAQRRIDAGERAGAPPMQAQSHGEISAAHERVIARHLVELSDELPDATRDRLERRLVDAAATGASTTAVAKLAKKLMSAADPAWAAGREARQQARRSACVGAVDPDGIAQLAIAAEPRMQALVDAVLARYARPGRCLAAPLDPETGLPLDDEAALAAADPRTSEQRAHDALAHVLALGLDADPAAARGVATIVVRVTPEQLDAIDGADGGGLVETDAGTQLSARQAVSMAFARDWFVSALRDGREELRRVTVDSNPRRRLASALQRLVLFAAHGGCTHPGCERAAARCEAHHVRDWGDGGPTTVANLALVCPTHHGRIGPEPEKWRTTADPETPGRPRWHPPGRGGHPPERGGGSPVRTPRHATAGADEYDLVGGGP